MAGKELTQEEKDEQARVKAHQAFAEGQRAKEEQRRADREKAAKSQPSLIVHGPVRS